MSKQKQHPNEPDRIQMLADEINATRNPRLVYEAMLALAPFLKKARSQQERAAILDALTPPTTQKEENA